MSKIPTIWVVLKIVALQFCPLKGLPTMVNYIISKSSELQSAQAGITGPSRGRSDQIFPHFT
jgi:hypothetical protein